MDIIKVSILIIFTFWFGFGFSQFISSYDEPKSIEEKLEYVEYINKLIYMRSEMDNKLFVHLLEKRMRELDSTIKYEDSLLGGYNATK